MNHSLKNISVLASVLLLSVSACSNYKETSEENFKKVINKYIKAPVCILNTEKFPIQDQVSPYNSNTPTLEALANIGLLTAQKTEQPGQQLTTYTYNLSEEGRKYFQPEKGLCYGMKEVTKINNYTEPTDTPQGKLSHVTYTSEVKDVPTWVHEVNKLTNSKPPTGIFNFSSGLEAGQRSETMTLVLTKNGWDSLIFTLLGGGY
jgi:hypothetical protein